MNKPVPTFQKGSSGDRSRKGRKQAWRNPRQVENYWRFYKKDVYVSRRPSNLPAWLLPLLVMVLIVALVFWAAPMVVSRLQSNQPNGQEPEQTALAAMYNTDTRVVLPPVADVFAQPDLKSVRVTQALLNEPVQVMPGEASPGFTAVQLQDGVTGFMLAKDLTDDRSSIEPAAFRYKAVVVNGRKRVMSHARQGALLVEVMMGTELYIDYRGAGVSRVALPDGATGWISDDGVVILPADGQIQKPYNLRQSFCNTALSFLQVTVLENGQTLRGISTAGIVRLSARVNGLDVPRTLEGLKTAGQPVRLASREADGLPELDGLLPGDLLFIADPRDPDLAAGLAIYVDAGQVIFARPPQTSIRLMKLADQEDIWSRIVAVRRLFP